MSGPVRSAFIYLMHLAWKSRLHIPFLLTVCFLVFDIRLQLEVNINMTRRRTHQRLGIEPNNIEDNNGGGNRHINDMIENDDEDDDDEDDEEDYENDDFEGQSFDGENEEGDSESTDDSTDTEVPRSTHELPAKSTCPANTEANA